MNAQFVMLAASEDATNKTFTLSIGVVDLDATPTACQRDEHGAPLINQAGLIVAADPLPEGSVLTTITETDPIGTVSETVIANLRSKATGPLAEYAARQSLTTLRALWSGVLVPVVEA